MQDVSLIARITIPNYLRSVQVSQKQREKYYEWNGTTIKSGSKKLLQKYINPIYKDNIIQNNGNIIPNCLKDQYVIIGFKGDREYSKISNIGREFAFQELPNSYMRKPTKFILCEEIEDGIKTYSIINKKVVANETQAGKPRNHIIKGQDFYVGLNPFIRTKIVDALKRSYYEKLWLAQGNSMYKLRQTLKLSYPLYIEMEIQDTIVNVFGKQPKDLENPGTRWDVGNRADPYLKTFLDFMANGYRDEELNHFFEPLIVDDDRLHISSGNNAYFTPIDDAKDCALVFYISKDTRTIWSRWFNRYRNYIKI